MRFEDIFGDDHFDKKVDPKPESEPAKKKAEPPKQEKAKGESLVKTNKKSSEKDGAIKGISINAFTTLGFDDEGKPIKAWVPRDRKDISKDVMALLESQGIDIFNTNGFLSTFDNSTEKWYLYDDPAKIGVLVDTHVPMGIGSHKKGVKVYQPTDCPKNVNEYISYSRDIVVKFPKVIGVARHPYFDKNFKIVNTAGYNPETGYYLPKNAVISRDAYTMKLQEAYDIFQEVFGCMNHKDGVDRQADFAAFLTPPWKMIVGNTPIVSVTANAPGSGKGLRQRLFNAIWSSKSAVISKPKNEDDLRKQLFAALRTGVNHVSIDNVSSTLLSDVIATYTTEPEISDRAVYGKDLETYKNIIFISINGNNLRLSEDIATRILPIHLDINESSLVKDYKSEGRKTESELLDYVDKNREKLVGASLRISKEYINDLMPDHPIGASRFPVWNKCVIGSAYHCLDSLNIDYLLDNFVVKAKKDADPESQNRANLFKAILDIIGVEDDDTSQSKLFTAGGDQDVGVFDLASHYDKTHRSPAKGHDLLGEHINATTERGRMVQVGKYFRDVAVGKVHYGWRLVKSELPLRIRRVPKTAYRLVLVGEPKKSYVPGTENWGRPTDVDEPIAEEHYPEVGFS